MQSWYKVTLPAAQSGINGKAKRLQDAFEVLFMSNAAPEGAAMFTNHDDSFDNYFYYFSPGAVEIARNLIEGYAGTTCSAPALNDGVALLVGHSGARERMLQP